MVRAVAVLNLVVGALQVVTLAVLAFPALVAGSVLLAARPDLSVVLAALHGTTFVLALLRVATAIDVARGGSPRRLRWVALGHALVAAPVAVLSQLDGPSVLGAVPTALLVVDVVTVAALAARSDAQAA